jgi:hypothetical protein
MIIDRILDRKDFEEYDAHDFYIYCMQINNFFGGIADEITTAMDYGTNKDVQKALCNYVLNNEYNPKICDYINAVNWL